jgi:AbrB family looped-hinge helix DNA binding protein
VAKVTSKLQVTIPKEVAAAYGITPGAEITFEPAGDVIRVRPVRKQRARSAARELRDRIAAFDELMKRQAERAARLGREHPEMFIPQPNARGWRREELYDRDLPR